MGEVAEGDPAALVAAISDQRTLHGIPHSVACRALGVSKAWFYKWRRRPAEPTKREARRRRLEERITHFFRASGDTYGSPRVTLDLWAEGWQVSVNTVAATLTCTRSDALPAGSDYPAITVTVNVAANASSPQVNQATVSGGGAPNQTVTDSTTITTATSGGTGGGTSLLPINIPIGLGLANITQNAQLANANNHYVGNTVIANSPAGGPICANNHFSQIDHGACNG